MKNNQKHIYIPINMLLFSAVLFVFTACQNSQNKTGLELTLLNNSLQVYCPNGDCSDYSIYKKNEIIDLNVGVGSTPINKAIVLMIRIRDHKNQSWKWNSYFQYSSSNKFTLW